MTNSNEAPDANLLNQLNTIVAGGDTSGVDVATMNPDEMKAFSENIAIAADEINNENSPVPTSDEAVQLKSSLKDKI